MSLSHTGVAPGPGHWLIRGVTGSGKTRALIAWASQLREQHPDWHVLLMCFNASLAAALRRRVSRGAVTEVAAFHDWAHARLSRGGVPIPAPPGRGALWDQYWAHDMARLLLQAFDDGRIPAGLYQAIAVDEGQDFVSDWYRALLRALDPSTDRLVVALDEAQNIYGRRVAWQDFGLDVPERTLALGVNHRNAGPIFRAALEMVRGLDTTGIATAAAAHAATDGLPPELRRCGSFDESREHALRWIRERLAAGVAATDMLVLGLSRLDMITVNAWLNSKGLPAGAPSGPGPVDGVRVSTIHAAKGLDAESVLLLDAHHLDTRDPVEARRLLYIGMTRARRELCVSYFRDTPLMDELRRALGPVS